MTTPHKPCLTGNPPYPHATAGGRCSVSVAWAKEMLEWAGWRVANGFHYHHQVYPDGTTRNHKCYAVWDGGGELHTYSTYGLRYEAVKLWMRYTDSGKNLWDTPLTTPTP